MIASAIHIHELVIGIYISPPSQTSLPPPSTSYPSRLSQSTGFGFPLSYSKFLLAIYFTYGNIYVSMLLSQIIPPSLSLMCPKSCCLMSESPLKVKVKSCLTLCNPMDCSLPGSYVHGIFQARVLEWVAISFSRRSSRPRD